MVQICVHQKQKTKKKTCQTIALSTQAEISHCAVAGVLIAYNHDQRLAASIHRADGRIYSIAGPPPPPLYSTAAKGEEGRRPFLAPRAAGECFASSRQGPLHGLLLTASLVMPLPLRRATASSRGAELLRCVPPGGELRHPPRLAPPSSCSPCPPPRPAAVSSRRQHSSLRA